MGLAILAPLACLILGAVALVWPERFAAAVGLSARDPLGRSELRAVFGGVFIGIAAACLLTASSGAYVAAGGAFLGGALAKVGSAAFERGVFPAVLPGLAVDIVLGLVFLLAARALAGTG